MEGGFSEEKNGAEVLGEGAEEAPIIGGGLGRASEDKEDLENALAAYAVRVASLKQGLDDFIDGELVEEAKETLLASWRSVPDRTCTWVQVRSGDVVLSSSNKVHEGILTFERRRRAIAKLRAVLPAKVTASFLDARFRTGVEVEQRYIVLLSWQAAEMAKEGKKGLTRRGRARRCVIA